MSGLGSREPIITVSFNQSPINSAAVQFVICLGSDTGWGLCQKMIRKSISNSANNSVWAITGDTSLPNGRKAGETRCPRSPRPSPSAHPSSRYGMDPFIQGGTGILQTASQLFKRKSCLWFTTVDLHCLGTHFELPDHPSSTDLTSKNISELGKSV